MQINSINQTNNISAPNPARQSPAAWRLNKSCVDTVSFTSAVVLSESEANAFFQKAKVFYETVIAKRLNLEMKHRLFLKNMFNWGEYNLFRGELKVNEQILTNPLVSRLVGKKNGKTFQLCVPACPQRPLKLTIMPDEDIDFFEKLLDCKIIKKSVSIEERKMAFIKVIAHEARHAKQGELMAKAGLCEFPQNQKGKVLKPLSMLSYDYYLALRFRIAKNRSVYPETIREALTNRAYWDNFLEVDARRFEKEFENVRID